MKRKLLLLATLILLPGLVGAASINKQDRGPKLVADEIIIKFDNILDDTLRGRSLAQFNLQKKRNSFKEGAFTVFKHGNPQAVLKQLRKLPGVIYAEQNAYAYTSTVQPDDPYYRYQWNMQRIGMGEAWELSAGAGAVVAVIDTGVRQGLLDLAQTAFTAGYDFVNLDTDANDDEGHGSHVSGTIAQSTNNGVGVAGIAHQATIMPVKVLDKSGSGSYDDIADGIIWATDNGADIINLSLGGATDLQVLQDACEYAWSNGVLVVVAAGNESTSAPSYPAAYDVCLSVSATTSQDTLASYSNFGSTIDIAAPGGDNGDYNGDGYDDMILQNTFNRFDEGYYFYAGTSMAAPHVAGVAALAKGLNPSLTNAELRLILESSAEDIGAPSKDEQFGFGLLNALATVVAAGGSTPINQPPTADFSYAVNGLEVTFSNLSHDPEGLLNSWSWDFGDGAISTVTNPVHTYQSAGSYQVALTVTDDASYSTKTQQVLVTDGTLTMSVADIALAVTQWGRNYQAQAQVTVLGTGSIPVTGATVSIQWDGAVSATATGLTGADGKVTFTSPRFRSGNAISIEVKNVSDDNYQYDPASNAETSDGLSW